MQKAEGDQDQETKQSVRSPRTHRGLISLGGRPSGVPAWHSGALSPEQSPAPEGLGVWLGLPTSAFCHLHPCSPVTLTGPMTSELCTR